MNRQILVILAVLAIALAVVAVSIEAQRGGGGRGGMGGSGGGGAAPVPTDDNGGNYDNGGNIDNVGNIDNGGNVGNVGNYDLPPGNYDVIEVSVSTDKIIYTEGEPLEITVTAYNPTDSTITLEFGTSSRDSLGCQVYYTIDDISPEWSACNAGSDEIPILPGGSYSWRPFTHTESVFPVTVGTHGVVGIRTRGIWSKIWSKRPPNYLGSGIRTAAPLFYPGLVTISADVMDPMYPRSI